MGMFPSELHPNKTSKELDFKEFDTSPQINIRNGALGVSLGMCLICLIRDVTSQTLVHDTHV